MVAVVVVGFFMVVVIVGFTVVVVGSFVVVVFVVIGKMVVSVVVGVVVGVSVVVVVVFIFGGILLNISFTGLGGLLVVEPSSVAFIMLAGTQWPGMLASTGLAMKMRGSCRGSGHFAPLKFDTNRHKTAVMI